MTPIPAPMTAAWAAVRAADPSMKRVGNASGHLPPRGHYLQALVFYRAITGRSPLGLPAPPVQVRRDSTFTIPPRDVEILQRAAAAAFPAAAARNTGE